MGLRVRVSDVLGEGLDAGGGVGLPLPDPAHVILPPLAHLAHKLVRLLALLLHHLVRVRIG